MQCAIQWPVLPAIDCKQYRECYWSLEDENKTVRSSKECVEHPRVGVDAVSCMNAMRNTMAGVTGD